MITRRVTRAWSARSGERYWRVLTGRLNSHYHKCNEYVIDLLERDDTRDDRRRLMIMIAGGSGRLGTLLVDRFSARGEDIRILSRTPPRALRQSVEFVVGDVRRPADADRAVAGARIVISAMSAFGMKGVTPRQVDLEGNANLIAACVRRGIEHFILVSVRGASLRHPTALHRMKYEAEQALVRSALSWTILRPSPFVETFQHVLCGPLLSTGKTVVFGRARNPINFVSAHDVAWCIERATTDATLRDTAVDIGGPENLSLLQFVEAFAAATGAHGSVKHVPLPMMRLMSIVARPFNPTFARLVQASVVMDTTDMTFDPSALRRQLPNLVLTSVADVARRDYTQRRPSTPLP